MKTAKEKLLMFIPENIKNEGYSFGDIEEEWILKAMIAYAKQFIDLAVSQAKIKDKKVLYTGMRAGNPDTAYYIVKDIDKESILDIKKLIK